MKLRDFTIGLGADINEGSFSAADKAMADMKAGAVGLASGFAAIVGASMALRAFADSVAIAGDQTIKTARNIGVNVEALQELRYAASLAGIENAELDNSMKFLQRGLAEAGEGTGEAKKGFERLGIAVKDASGNLKSSDQIIEEVANKISGLNEAERVATSMEIFGRSGNKMVGMLMQGGDALRLFREEAKATGAVIESESLEAMEAYNDANFRLSETMRGLKTQFAMAIIPALTESADKMRQLLSPAISYLRENMDGLKTAVKMAGAAFGALAIGAMLFGVGKLAIAFTGLATAIAATGTTGLVAWMKMLAFPIMIGAALTALIYIIQDVWKTFNDPKADTMLRRLLDILKSEFPQAFAVFKSGFIIMMDGIFYSITKMINGLRMIYNLLGRDTSGFERAFESERKNKANFEASVNYQLKSGEFAPPPLKQEIVIRVEGQGSEVVQAVETYVNQNRVNVGALTVGF